MKYELVNPQTRERIDLTPYSRPLSYDWDKAAVVFRDAAVASGKSFAQLERVLQQMSRVVITDEMLHALAQAGQLGWSYGFKWRRDVTLMVNYGERRKQRPPRREKRRARKRKGKR